MALCPPYLDEFNVQETEFLEHDSFGIITIKGLNLEKDGDMIRVRPEAIKALTWSVDSPAADAVLISFGALRSIDIADTREVELSKTGICSNQAMIWDMLRLAGIDEKIVGCRRLVREY